MKSFFETREEIRFNDGIAIGREEGLEKGRQEGRQEGREEGLETGLKKGRAEGQITTWCAAVKKIMINLKMTLEDALDWLEIPLNFRPAVIKGIEQ